MPLALNNFRRQIFWCPTQCPRPKARERKGEGEGEGEGERGREKESEKESEDKGSRKKGVVVSLTYQERILRNQNL